MESRVARPKSAVTEPPSSLPKAKVARHKSFDSKISQQLIQQPQQHQKHQQQHQHVYSSYPFPLVPSQLRERAQVPAQSTQEILALKDFAAKYSLLLPVQIKVMVGYLGESSRVTLSAQDRLNIHFLKHVKVVCVENEYGSRYSIPIYSSIEFCLIYDPEGNREKALRGYSFQKVSDILSMSPLPKCICVGKQWKEQDDKSGLSNGEVLVLHKVSKPKLMGKKVLRVHSMTTNSMKQLPEDCVGNFTTRPELIHFYLPELIKQVPDLFPTKTCVYSDRKGNLSQQQSMEVPSHLGSTVFTMVKEDTESTLVATTVVENASESHDQLPLIDIPVNLPDVEVLPQNITDAQETEILYDKTRHILEKYNPKNAQSFVNLKAGNLSEVQSMLYSKVREGFEEMGTELDYSSVIYESIPAHMSATAHDKASTEASSSVMPPMPPDHPPPSSSSTQRTPTTTAPPPTPPPPQQQAQRSPKQLPPSAHHANGMESTPTKWSPGPIPFQSSSNRGGGGLEGMVDFHPRGSRTLPRTRSPSLPVHATKPPALPPPNLRRSLQEKLPTPNGSPQTPMKYEDPTPSHLMDKPQYYTTMSVTSAEMDALRKEMEILSSTQQVSSATLLALRKDCSKDSLELNSAVKTLSSRLEGMDSAQRALGASIKSLEAKLSKLHQAVAPNLSLDEKEEEEKVDEEERCRRNRAELANLDCQQVGYLVNINVYNVLMHVCVCVYVLDIAWQQVMYGLYRS